MGLKDRVYRFIEHKGISVRDFERSVGLSNGAVSKMGDDTRKSTIDKVSAAYPYLNTDWLITGEGAMERTGNATPVGEVDTVYLPIVPYTARAGSIGDYEQLFGDETSERQPVLVTQQMHGRYLCFRVGGDSMEPTLRHGDVVMARYINPDLYRDSKLHLRDWSVWIIVTRSEGILIKGVAEHNVEEGVLTLHSVNPLYPDMTIHMSDVLDIYNAIEIVSRHL